MVNAKLISTLTLSPLSNNTKRLLSAYLKGRTASCRYNFTFSPFHARIEVPQDACITPTLFNFFASKFSQSDNLLINSSADSFTVSCSNSNVAVRGTAFPSRQVVCWEKPFSSYDLRRIFSFDVEFFLFVFQVLLMLCGVARGLQWLRSNGVAHGSLCARNIVLQVSTFCMMHFFFSV